jgi:hypothetical protein
LQKNEVCLLSPNFKPTSNQTKMQKVKKHFIFIILNTKKPRKDEKNRNKQKTHNVRNKMKTDNIRIENKHNHETNMNEKKQ